jgi:hypothetical protein
VTLMADIENWSKATFEEKYKAMMAGMSEAQQKKSAEQVLYMCQCRKCMTNTETGDINAVHCALGRSASIRKRSGCLCSSCPMTKTLSMRWSYYCIEGSAVGHSNVNR